jgi:hypothetical protein
LDLAKLVKYVVDFEVKIIADTTKPESGNTYLYDVLKLNILGWEATISLKVVVIMVYEGI